MASEQFDLEVGKDRYSLRLDMPIKAVFFRLGKIDYAVVLVPPMEMIAARSQAPELRPIGYPYMAAIMEPMTLDIYPKPSAGLLMSVFYDWEGHVQRQKERERAEWIREYERYHPPHCS